MYKGEPSLIVNSTFYKLEVNEKNLQEKYETVSTTAASSKDGPVAIITNLEDIGSVTSEFSYGEVNKDKQNYESTTITIWNDNEEEMHTETIALSIDHELILD